MFDCPKCGADRSMVAPALPCPDCGAKLERDGTWQVSVAPPATEADAPKRMPSVDESMPFAGRDQFSATQQAPVPPPPSGDVEESGPLTKTSAGMAEVSPPLEKRLRRSSAQWIQALKEPKSPTPKPVFHAPSTQPDASMAPVTDVGAPAFASSATDAHAFAPVTDTGAAAFGPSATVPDANVEPSQPAAPKVVEQPAPRRPRASQSVPPPIPGQRSAQREESMPFGGASGIQSSGSLSPGGGASAREESMPFGDAPADPAPAPAMPPVAPVARGGEGAALPRSVQAALDSVGSDEHGTAAPQTPPQAQPQPQPQSLLPSMNVPPPQQYGHVTPPGAFAAPQGAPAAPAQQPDVKAEWKTPHRSAAVWAEKRRGALSGQIRRRPRPQAVLLGMLVAGFAGWMMVSYLPSHKPLSKEQRAKLELQAGANVQAWRLAPRKYGAAQLACAGLMLVGMTVAARGVLFRRRRRIKCRVCRGDVIAATHRFQYRCENGPHAARVRFTPVLLLLAFSSFGATLLIVIAMAVLGNAGTGG